MKKSIFSEISDKLLYDCLYEGTTKNNEEIVKEVVNVLTDKQKQNFLKKAIKAGESKVANILLKEEITVEYSEELLDVVWQKCGAITTNLLCKKMEWYCTGDLIATIFNDKEGEVEIRVIDVKTIDEKNYLAGIVVKENGNEQEEDEMLILQIVEEKGNETYYTLSSNKELERIYNKFREDVLTDEM